MIVIDHFPAKLFQGWDERVIVGDERVGEVERLPVLAPAGANRRALAGRRATWEYASTGN